MDVEIHARSGDMICERQLRPLRLVSAPLAHTFMPHSVTTVHLLSDLSRHRPLGLPISGPVEVPVFAELMHCGALSCFARSSTNTSPIHVSPAMSLDCLPGFPLMQDIELGEKAERGNIIKGAKVSSRVKRGVGLLAAFVHHVPRWHWQPSLGTLTVM
jgi:hypothetical protein